MSDRVRIVAIAQLHNELKRGNLQRFVEQLQPVVDDMVLYDNGSTDGSWQYLQSTRAHLIRGLRNDFVYERSIRQQLLTKALELKPDFILWLDGDEVLTANAKSELQRAAQWCTEKNLDGVALHELNLWRSGSWRRIDNAYDDGWFVRLWRVQPGLAFSHIQPGLHQQLHPDSIRHIGRYEALSVIHYGFATQDSILYKYLNYQRHGQHGWELQRLLDESTLQVERITDELVPSALRTKEPAPTARPLQWWLRESERQRHTLLRPSVTIVALIYKSTKWLKFSYEQILKFADRGNVEILFVANDAADHVKAYLRNYYIPHVIFDNTPEHRQEWYINNVYRAWNYGGLMAQGEYILFVNSDMAFTPDWVEKLMSRVDGKNCVASRLIESGKMPSGQYGISKNFGQSIESFDEMAFQKYAASIEVDELNPGGLYMPLLIKKEDFLGVGGYPEGNVAPGSDPFHPTIAQPGDPIVSGDVILMEKLGQRGVIHQTDFHTISYHFQEGEMDDAADPMNQAKPKRIAVINDWLQGRLGEKTMWNMLTEGLPSSIGIDSTTVSNAAAFSTQAKRWLEKNHPNVDVIIQNASFIDTVDSSRHTVMFLQDDLRRMGRPSKEQEANLKMATSRVTNSLLTAQSYPEYNFQVIPLGVDHHLFHPRERSAIRQELNLPNQPTAIFVGDLSPVKGWDEIQSLIKRRQDIHWIIVSKKNESWSAPNVTTYQQVDQPLLAKLYNAANVFVLGSPVETQCLAAIEAGMCGVPIVMHETGIFWEMSEDERSQVGWFGKDLEAGIRHVVDQHQKYQPRQFLIEYGLTVNAMVQRWHRVVEEALLQKDQEKIHRASTPMVKRLQLSTTKNLRRSSSAVFTGLKSAARVILPKKMADSLYRKIYERRR